MQENYEIENLDQLRAIADMRRLRIIELLRERPMTVTQLGDLLGESPAKVHYHVRELEKVGLLCLVETREKGGILEKYYQPIAREISVEKQLLAVPTDEALAAASRLLNQIKEGFQSALRTALSQKDQPPKMTFGFMNTYLTAEEQEQLSKQIFELIKPYENRRGIAGEQEMLYTLLVYPREPSEPAPSRRTNPTFENTQIVGTATFNRADLEKAQASNKHLNIDVIGLCKFTDDITAELADHAIDRFQLIGTLQAPPAVREVLMEKQRMSNLSYKQQ